MLTASQGMIKMYNAEVLSKFPVVQHFPFGSLFSWERDSNTVPPPTSAHMASGPQSRPKEAAPPTRQAPDVGTKAPWATAPRPAPAAEATVAPWAAKAEGTPGMAAPGSSRVPSVIQDTSRLPPGPMAPTKARGAEASPVRPVPGDSGNVQTKAPRAK